MVCKPWTKHNSNSLKTTEAESIFPPMFGKYLERKYSKVLILFTPEQA